MKPFRLSVRLTRTPRVSPRSNTSTLYQQDVCCQLWYFFDPASEPAAGVFQLPIRVNVKSIGSEASPSIHIGEDGSKYELQSLDFEKFVIRVGIDVAESLVEVEAHKVVCSSALTEGIGDRLEESSGVLLQFVDKVLVCDGVNASQE